MLAYLGANQAMADLNYTVTPVSIGVYTTSSSDSNWNSGDKLFIRLLNSVNQDTCTSNVVWFSRSDNVMLSVALTAISRGKQASIGVRTDTKVGGAVCELVRLEPNA